jgi:all-trans-retinol dehydrogenase (NAD+)
MQMTKYFLEQMMNREAGHIVSISSMAGLHPSPQIIQYTATKFGVSGYMAALTEFLRQQKLGDKIKTTCVFPFFIKTNETVTNFLNPK